MIRPTPKTALVTHRNCLDGTGAAAVFIWAGGKRENVLFRDPKGCALTAEQAAPYNEVWFVDLCPWDLINPAGGKPWKVIDHHDTNVRRHGQDCPGCTFDQTKCGTSLLAQEVDLFDVAMNDTERYFNARLGRLIGAIEAYDLGRFDHLEGVMLADLFSAYSQSEMLDRFLFDLRDGVDIFESSDTRFMAIGIQMAREQYSAKAAANMYSEIMAFGDEKPLVAIAVAPRYWGNSVAEACLARKVGDRMPDMVAVIDYASNSVSFRSRGAIDVAKVAEMFGGGGHPRAAGVRLDKAAAFKALAEGIFG